MLLMGGNDNDVPPLLSSRRPSRSNSNLAGPLLKHALTGTLQTRLRRFCAFVVAP